MGLFSKNEQPLPPPPPPLPPQPQQRNSVVTQPAAQNHPAGSIAIGVETEILVAAGQPNLAADSIEQFCQRLAASYAECLKVVRDVSHPGMHNAINETFRGERFSEWSLEEEPAIEPPNVNKEPWPIEIISPKLRLHAGSGWRSHIEFLWKHLSRHYHVSANDTCGTHVHMSIVGGYTLQALQRIACCILHFEPAFEALLPEARRGNKCSKSNWIDNKNFGHKNVSREASMDLIMDCKDERSLILLMNPDSGGEHDKMFGWNFLNLLQNLRLTIEFRRGAPSMSAEDVFKWTEIATSFIEASMKLGTRDKLRKTPRNAGGLKFFIDAAQLPTTVFEPQHLTTFFSAAPMSASAQPIPVGQLSSENARKLKQTNEEDKQHNTTLAETLTPPYWD